MAKTNELKELIRIGDLLSSSDVEEIPEPLKPSLVITTESGSIPSGAKYVAIAVLTGSGSVLGVAVNPDIQLEFPFNAAGWQEITYTVDPDSEFMVQVGA